MLRITSAAVDLDPTKTKRRSGTCVVRFSRQPSSGPARCGSSCSSKALAEIGGGDEKLHHSMADGLAAAELAMVLLDVSPVTPPAAPPAPWRPELALRW